MFKSKLQRKILLAVISLLSFIILLMLSLFLVLDYLNLMDRSKVVGLQSAKMLSFMDAVQDGVIHSDSEYKLSELQALITYYEAQIDATFIVIHNKAGEVLASPQLEKIGREEEFDDGFKAIVFGANYSMESSEIIGPSVVSKAPIYNEQKQIIGVVTVGYLLSDLREIVYERSFKLLYFSLFILALGILLSLLLARSIRKDTFGLEPEDIAKFYMERKAILASIDEGIIAVNRNGEMTIVNTAAKRILGVSNEIKGKQVSEVFPDFPSPLNHDGTAVNRTLEMNYNDNKLIVQVSPMQLHENVRGAVYTVRDKTEIMEVVNTLYEVRKYSDDLRAQTHEFTNKLYLISGLMQLGKYEEAICTIQKEMEINDHTSQFILENLIDTNVQAILFGKLGKASEWKVSFEIDENSSLEPLPEFISPGALTTVLGNLIDNALEETAGQTDGRVTFFTIDLGDYIIFEVSDNGRGIPPDKEDELFNQGYSTKNELNRGFGLWNVKRIVKDLGGDIQVSSEEGAVFTVYIPKRGNVGEEQND
ncbi:sensor histidine kinase [Sporosarcina cyprini]|uniref:sensor histidine kinase n=1 Tax=Sporosarcina cyprini TaxID=2910523 RepID=UPI001EDDDAF3|nr:sensor histidine kinase [Sporosarcina cyprini]